MAFLSLSLIKDNVVNPTKFTLVLDDAIKETRQEVKIYGKEYRKMRKIESSETFYVDDTLIRGNIKIFVFILVITGIQMSKKVMNQPW